MHGCCTQPLIRETFQHIIVTFCRATVVYVYECRANNALLCRKSFVVTRLTILRIIVIKVVVVAIIFEVN